MKSFIKIFIVNLITALFLFGCGIKELKNYEEFHDYSKPGSKLIRLPVVIVPGIKGSLLKRGDKEFWGKSYRVAFLHTFDELQFPIKMQLNDYFNDSFGKFYNTKNVRDGGIMEKYWIALPFLNILDVSIYNNIGKVLEKSGGYSLNNDLFMFSYDWRLDNRISAAHLAWEVEKYQKLFLNYLLDKICEGNVNEFKKCKDKLKQKKLMTDDGHIKVNLIAHSMGGLVARYYIQMLGGEDNVNKLIMLGTPNQGAMDSFKAIAEGEFPESILHFYKKKSTRSIIFSWPSAYQLLPRYASCLKKGNSNYHKNFQDWGLCDSYSIILDDTESDKVINNWVSHNLVPEAGFDSVDTLEVKKKFLKEQLISAAKFHNAINAKFDEKYEERKLNMIKSFSDAASIDVKVEKKFIDHQAKTPFILFGGHCEPTLKYAYITEKENNVEHLEFDNPQKNKDKNKTSTMGDGRVPIVSLRLPTRENPSDFQFLLCEGHANLVSNKTFQYNLLRELLWQTSCLK